MRILRLIHNGVFSSPPNNRSILIDDIDLENRERNGVPRSVTSKQPCYVPLLNKYDENQPGFIDLRFSDRVLSSYQFGKIRKSVEAGWLNTVIFEDVDLTIPEISDFSVSAAIYGTFTIDGQNFKSVSPDVTAVLITVNGAVPPIEIQISESELLAAPYSGSISPTQIQFQVPFTSTLGQLLRQQQDLGVRVYSDGRVSEQFNKLYIPS